jgi:L-ascorbate metabolism protein UlaG (beta-lactamase superfamily)
LAGSRIGAEEEEAADCSRRRRQSWWTADSPHSYPYGSAGPLLESFPAQNGARGLSVTWLGHSAVILENEGTRILTDPLLRPWLGHLRRAVPPASPGLVDAVLISHVHLDHLDMPSLRTFGPRTRFFVPRGAAKLLRRRGLFLVDEVLPGDRVSLPGFEIEVTSAHHKARRTPVSRLVPSLGYVISGGARAYFAGDTDVFDDMAYIGGVDVALLPIAGWTRRIPPGHLDAVRALEALRLIRPRVVVPIHWGTYHPRPPFVPRVHELELPLHRFREELAAQSDLAPQLHVLRPGEGFCLGTTGELLLAAPPPTPVSGCEGRGLQPPVLVRGGWTERPRTRFGRAGRRRR